MCYLLLTPCWASTQGSSGILLKIGEPAPYTGYLFNERTTRDIAEGWKTSKMEFEIISRAYEDLKRESLESIDALNKEIVSLNAAILEDAKRARRTRRHKSFKIVLISTLVGAGLGMVIHNNR